MAVTLVSPEYLVDRKGRTKAVLLRAADYKRLLRRLEDLEDALALDKAAKTAKGFRDYTDIRAEIGSRKERTK
jgi:PHD/YefM family antitoxin component YafN of YafNO toxin-antitoxin module